MANSAISVPALFAPADGTVTPAKAADGFYAAGKNAIINGAFDIWQRGTSFAAIATGAYSADRFKVDHSSGAVFTINQSTDVPTVAQAGVLASYSLHVDVTTADGTVGAGEYAHIYQTIEGYVWRNFAQRDLTLSFWVKSPKTGTHYCFVLNGSADRSVALAYTVDATDTWEKKEISVPASPSDGTWDYTNGAGALVGWSLMAGDNLDNGSVGSWSSTFGTAGASPPNLLDNTANNFKLALVQLEVGDTATDFELRPYPLELELCQRYFVALGGANSNEWVGSGVTVDTNTCYALCPLPTTMRTAPSVSYSAVSDWHITDASGSSTVSSISLNGPGTRAVNVTFAGSGGWTVAGRPAMARANATTNARLYLSAEF
jgi:hypothetical protein